MINNDEEFRLSGISPRQAREELNRSLTEQAYKRVMKHSKPSELIEQLEILEQLKPKAYESATDLIDELELQESILGKPSKTHLFQAGQGAGTFANAVKQDLERIKREGFTPPEHGISVSRAMNGIKQVAPGIWNAYAPHIYKGVDAFHDPRYIALHYIGIYASYVMMGVPQTQESAETLMGLARGIPLRFPLYFVARDIFDACLNSDTLPEIDWLHMDLPAEQMNFVLPKNAFKVKGFYLTAMSITRVKRGIYKIPEIDTFAVDQDLLMIHCLDERFLNYRRVINEVYRPGVTVFPEFAKSDNPFELPLDGSDRDALERLTNLAFNLILLMLARPQLVEMGRQVKAHCKRGGSAIWTPNIVGAKYRRPSKPPTGTHSSPVMHLRRGHFRQQWIGKREKVGNHYKYKDSKIIFIEPIWVGAEK
jgi:hypothetical protein